MPNPNTTFVEAIKRSLSKPRIDLLGGAIKCHADKPIEERVNRFTLAARMHWAEVLDHATSEIAIGSKLGIDATKKPPGEGFKRPWPPLIKMDESVKAKMERLFNP